MDSIEQAFNSIQEIKKYLCQFADTYEVCVILDSNETQTALNIGKYEMLIGLGLKVQYTGSVLEQLNQANSSSYWKFVSMEYGNITNNNAYIFEPEYVFAILKNEKKLRILNNGVSKEQFQHMLRSFREVKTETPTKAPVHIEFTAATTKEEYKNTVANIREDIINGKYYEMNYCIAFNAYTRPLPWMNYFYILNNLSKAPFASFCKLGNKVILCSSPERFLMKNGNHLISQPIKGTNKLLTGKQNIQQLEKLKNSEKERAENVMIVDLVRNDLAKVCIPGTIKVDELFGTYAYKTVNHLVSTVSGTCRSDVNLLDIFEALYPMGSMTGAPKIEVMKYIHKYEKEERGTYSGCIGYISPTQDFDFNVVIRTLVYEKDQQLLSYNVGSAITFDSNDESEYEECLLKGARMADTFSA